MSDDDVQDLDSLVGQIFYTGMQAWRVVQVGTPDSYTNRSSIRFEKVYA